MKASLFAQMGYSERHKFPATWPVPPSYHDPAVTMQSYEDGLEECELAEEMGFDWVSCSEHHYSGNRLTPNPAVMAAAVSQRCKKVRIALLGQLLQHHNPVRAAEEIGMLDNLTGGRVIMAFLRGIPSEDLPYGMNPAEGRARLFEGMDLLLKALTEPQPFSWEGRYYQFRTVSVCPRPVQQPLPPVIVATRSEDAVRYAASHHLGLAVSMIRWTRWPRSLRSTARGAPKRLAAHTRPDRLPRQYLARRDGPAGGKSAGGSQGQWSRGTGHGPALFSDPGGVRARDGKAFDPRNRNVCRWRPGSPASGPVQAGAADLGGGPRHHREAVEGIP